MLGAQLVQVLAHGVAKRAAGLQHGVHVRHLALNQLKLTNALPKLLAVMDVGHNAVHHRLHDADGPGGQHGAFIVQATHEHLGALVQAAQDIFRGHLHVFEHQLAGVATPHAQLVKLLRNRKAFHAFFDEESRHATRTQFGFGLGIHHQGIGVRSVGDPHLVAIEQVVATLVFSTQLHADNVRPRTRLAHGQRSYVLTRDQLGQVFGLLCLVAVALDLVDAQVAVRPVAQAHAGTGARNFLHGNHVRQVSHVSAPIGLGHGDAQHAQIAHLAPQVHGELIRLIDLRRARGNFGLGEITHRIAQCVDIFAQVKVQARQ